MFFYKNKKTNFKKTYCKSSIIGLLYKYKVLQERHNIFDQFSTYITIYSVSTYTGIIAKKGIWFKTKAVPATVSVDEKRKKPLNNLLFGKVL